MPEPQRVVVQALGSNTAAEITVSTGVRSMSALPAVRMLRRNPDASDDLREMAKAASRRFNHRDVWLPLAAALEQIRRERAYERWGFRSISAYAEDELDITKGTASDLLNALHYVMTIHPEYLTADSSTVELPPYSSVAALSRNTKCLSRPLITQLDELLFSGRLTRAALQELITRAKGGRISWHADRPQRRSSVRSVRDQGRDFLMRELEALFGAVDLDDLWHTTTAVFGAWETDNLAERRQLLAQLSELIEHLTKIEELLDAARV